MVEIKTVKDEPLFPTYIWVMDLEPGDYEPLNRQVLRDLNELTRPRPQLPPGRNWQTEQTMHQLDEFQPLMEVFKTASRKVISLLEIKHEAFAITGCWANINPKGAFHMPHVHPNNFLSGIYYAQSQPGADSVSFHDPRPQLGIFKPEVARENIYNSIIRSLPIKPGRIMMFPSWLVHSVTVNRSDQLRISISFNIMLTSFVEQVAQPNWEGIPFRLENRRPAE
ncbi:MAG: 2OG-Fe(II) oxygenase family protein [Pseudomonadota bacterium]